MNRRDFLKTSLVTSLADLAFKSAGAATDALTSHVELVSAEAPPAVPRRIWTQLVSPRQHPDYSRRHVRPPDWDVFRNQTQFAALRGLQIEDGRIVNFEPLLEKYTRTYQLGDVLWLFRDVLFTDNLEELVDSIRRRNLYLFDIWGYVPGSGPPGAWQQFQPPQQVFDMLESQLGERWLGMDNGEQDGRYIGGYASEFYPGSSNRIDQYLNFHRHFAKLTSDLGNRLSTLVSLTFGHYFLKEGLYTLIGAETAQSLGNAQIYYSFIRGAGKQYGVLWFGNASIYNRWGWKSYSSRDQDSGPTKGTSLSLMKRLMYSQILYNSVLVAFEGSFLACSASYVADKGCSEDELSPIGRIQQAAGIWVHEHGQPGPMIAPIALMLDFFAGWTFPRHLYTSDTFRVWGNLPYGPGDYLTDAIFQLLYPGYRDSSYFHDESGFLTPAPWGDASDCLLTDAPLWVMRQYSLIVLAGELEGGVELKDKFEAYLHSGGHLIITAANLAKFSDGLSGVTTDRIATPFSAECKVTHTCRDIREKEAFELYGLKYPATAEVLASVSGRAAAVRMPWGTGWLTVLASPFGLTSDPSGTSAALKIRNEVNIPLRSPRSLLEHVRIVLDQAFQAQTLFEPGEGLSLITCRKDAGEFTLGVVNQTWQPRPIKIISRCGQIKSIRELALDQSEKAQPGYLPEGLTADIGVSDQDTIAGGDIRIFRIRIEEQGIHPIPQITPPSRPRGRALPLRGMRSIKEEVLRRPSFFEHYDAVVVDWRYVHERQQGGLEEESAWLKLQRLSMIVDFTSGINLYPNLRLIDNLPQSYATSLAIVGDVLNKMPTLPAQDAIFALHRYPENNFTRQQTWQSFVATFRTLSRLCRTRNITMHLRLRLHTPPEDFEVASRFLADVDADNLMLAPCTSPILAGGINLAMSSRLLSGRVGMWLLNAPDRDASGKVWNENAPIRTCRNQEMLNRILAISPQSPLVFDAVYENCDSEYLDSRFVKRMAFSESGVSKAWGAQ